MLRPRVRILADEHLTGAAREHVQTRLDLWTKHACRTAAGAAVRARRADDVTGIARGIAFQIVEALGVLERHRVADDVKALDQAQRATLRKHGVRFGAYHIYVPALLKPAPRALGGGAVGAQARRSRKPQGSTICTPGVSGRTSFPVDKSISRALYRTIGYRVCGERAVRVDILERLADLIRPALSWRPESPGQQARWRIRRDGLHGHAGDDLADRLVGRGLCLDHARARLSDGKAAEAAG